MKNILIVLALILGFVLGYNSPDLRETFKIGQQIVAVDVYFNDGTAPSYTVIDCRQEGLSMNQLLADMQTWAYEDNSVEDMVIEVNGRKFWSFKAYD